MNLFIGFLATLLGVPVIRDFLTKVAVGVASEILIHPATNPKFKADYLDLSAQLVAAETEGEKRAILIKIRDLRKPPQ